MHEYLFFLFLINYYKYLGQSPIVVVLLTDVDPKYLPISGQDL
jgi:hypothetical protein